MSGQALASGQHCANQAPIKLDGFQCAAQQQQQQQQVQLQLQLQQQARKRHQSRRRAPLADSGAKVAAKQEVSLVRRCIIIIIIIIVWVAATRSTNASCKSISSCAAPAD